MHCFVMMISDTGLVVPIKATVKWCIGVHITACFDEHNVQKSPRSSMFIADTAQNATAEVRFVCASVAFIYIVASASK